MCFVPLLKCTYKTQTKTHRTNMVDIKNDENIGKTIEKIKTKTNIWINVVVPGGYRMASPEADLAPREAENWEGSWKLST